MIHLAPGQHGFDLLPLALALFVMPLFSIYSGRQIAKAPERSLVPRYVQTLVRGWLMIGLVVAIWWKTQRPFPALGLDLPINRLGLYGFIFCAAILALIVIQHFYFFRLMKPERLAQLRLRMTQIKILPRTPNELLVFLPVAITAGIWEELVYRGFLFWFLTPYVNVIGAIAISTIVFAVGHAYQGFRGMLSSGTLGLLFMVAFVFTHSLWWLMVVHALIDLNGGFSGFRGMRLAVAAE